MISHGIDAVKKKVYLHTSESKYILADLLKNVHNVLAKYDTNKKLYFYLHNSIPLK